MWLRIFFLMAQPPLLYQEGNCHPDIDSQLHRPCRLGEVCETTSLHGMGQPKTLPEERSEAVTKMQGLSDEVRGSAKNTLPITNEKHQEEIATKGTSANLLCAFCG